MADKGRSESGAEADNEGSEAGKPARDGFTGIHAMQAHPR